MAISKQQGGQLSQTPQCQDPSPVSSIVVSGVVLSLVCPSRLLQAELAHENSMLLSTAGPYTSAFFNPALAASVTFHCDGNTLLEYAHVYCLGPVAGKQWEKGWPG